MAKLMHGRSPLGPETPAPALAGLQLSKSSQLELKGPQTSLRDQSLRPLAWIGAANGSGSHDAGTGQGPIFLKSISSELDGALFSQLRIVNETASGRHREALRGLVDFNRRLAQSTRSAVRRGLFPYVIGGDHACAIGTWSGIASLYQAPLGMLWIDAHMDSHDFESSETGNIHGMPLATLLGKGHPDLMRLGGERTKLDPKRCVLFGVRSFERGEARHLEELKVRVYMMSEILERGFQVCWQEALRRVQGAGEKFGISLDLDGLDPHHIPGVGTPVPHGLHPSLVLQNLRTQLAHPDLVGFEVVEFNPEHDIGGQSLAFLIELSHLLENRHENRGFLGSNGPLAPWPSSLWPLSL